MGLREKVFGKKREPQAVTLPAVLEPEDPVNFDSVLDYIIGLSDEDYQKLGNVVQIYRDANDEAAKALGVKNKPTTTIKRRKLTNKQIDDGLDQLLETHPDDLNAAIAAEKPKDKKKRVTT